MSTIDQLLELEHAGWQSLCDDTGARFYGSAMSDDAVMVLAHGAVLDRSAVVASLDEAPPWSGYEITDTRLIDVLTTLQRWSTRGAPGATTTGQRSSR